VRVDQRCFVKMIREKRSSKTESCSLTCVQEVASKNAMYYRIASKYLVIRNGRILRRPVMTSVERCRWGMMMCYTIGIFPCAQ
jgi:hypothetical protein